MGRTKQLARHISDVAYRGQKSKDPTKTKPTIKSSLKKSSERKPHRYRPGTVALREIGRYQLIMIY